ncbi:MAG: hypothetical protein WC287_01035 [Candidatus Paceibacterota bacterium]|jgi:hypothetical protein
MSKNKLGIIAGLCFALMVVVTPVMAACDLQHPAECTNDQLIALITGLLGTGTGTGTGTTGTINGIPAGFQFTTNLMQGSSSNDVKYLQILLNSDTATQLGATGAGSPGNETSYFGPITKAAVIKFQNKYASEVLAPYGLTAGTGYFGSTSRAKANALIAAGTDIGTTLPEGCTSTSGFSPVTGQSCSSGGTVVLPEGCTSTSGYSPTTGQPCSSTTPVTGGFSVVLASDNPASGTLVQGQATADLLHFLVSNGTSSEVMITAVELTRLGVSADATLSSVYLFEGAARITDAGTVSAGKVTFNNPNGVIILPANTSKIVSVKSDILAASQGQTIGVSVSGITASTTLSGTALPIVGNIHTIANATLATVTVGAPLPTLAGAATPTDPVEGVRAWESTFTINNRNVNFSRLSLRQINSISSSDVANFKLIIDGEEVATVASLDANGYVTFTFNKVLQTGTRNVKVLVDINGGSGRNLQLSMRNKADIDVKDSEYNVNVSVTGAPATANALSINQGLFTITADNAALPVTVANNSSNVLIGKWKFKATGEAVKVETLTAEFTYAETGGAGVTVNANATLRNGKIMIDGVQYGSTTTLVEAGGVGTPYGINYTFQPGVETMVELYADIFDNDTTQYIEAGDTIKAGLVAGVGNGTKQVSLGTIAVPTAGQAASTVASTITVATAGATLVTTPSYGNQNTVLPVTTGFKIGSWTLTAGTTESININNLNFAIAAGAVLGGTGTFIEDDMSDMYVVYSVAGGAAVTSSTRPTPIASNDFPVSFVLGKTQTATIDLYSNLLAGGVTVGESTQATLTVTGTGSQSGAAAVIAGAGTGQEIIYQAASLTITRDASTPAASLVPGNSNVKTVSYKFEALNDTYTVLQMVIGITDPTAVISATLKDGSTPIQTVTGVSTAVTFSVPFTVLANTPKVLDVELTLGTIGSGAGATGANVTTSFTSALIRPASTGTAAPYATGAPAAGNAIYAYKSVPTISLEALPSSILAIGTKTLSKFTIGSATSATNWKQVMFSITRDGGGATITGCNGTACPGLKLYQGGVEVPGTAIASGDLTSAGANTITVQFIPDNEEQIGIGTSKTYELKGDVGGTVSTGHYISTSITSPSVAKTASGPFAKHLTAVSTWRYVDASTDATGGAVAADDVRQSPTSKYTTVDVAAGGDTTITEHDAALKIQQAYGITDDIVLTLAENADNQAATATFAVTGLGAGDLICTPFTGAAGAGAFAAGGVFSTIQSVVCAGTGSQLKIFGLAVTDDADGAGSGTGLVITITKAADYATGDVVVATDSDFALAFAGGTEVAQTASFIWSDLSGLSHSVVTSDWATDFLVKNLATDTQTIQAP